MIGLADIEAAARRIGPHIRHTPIVEAAVLRRPVTEAALWLKLECLQPTGSFKVRGATNRLLTASVGEIANGIVTASGGNHGLATARAAQLAGVQATIFVPSTVAPTKLDKLRRWNATVEVVGSIWDETNQHALAFAERRNAAYFHPFADPAVVAGQGTIGLELMDDVPDIDTVVVAIGGGGLIAGMSVALKALKPDIRIIGVEPVGSPTLHASLAAGGVVSLPEVKTKVATMTCGRTDERVFEIVRERVDEVVLVSDEDLAEAAKWLWFEMGLAADLSGAAAVAALQSGKLQLSPERTVGALVCGAGQEALV
jgi:threonine dehydratase